MSHFHSKEDASCSFSVLDFTRKARTTFKRKEEHCGLETRFVGPTRWMGEKRLEIEITTAVAGGRLWKKLHRVLRIVGRIPKNRGEWKEISREFNNWALPLKKSPTPGRKAVKKELKEKVTY